MNVKNFIDEILLEWSARVDSGIPDIKDEKDLTILQEILSSRLEGIKNKNQLITEIIDSIKEADEEPEKKPKKEPVPKEPTEKPAETPAPAEKPAETEKPAADEKPAETPKEKPATTNEKPAAEKGGSEDVPPPPSEEPPLEEPTGGETTPAETPVEKPAEETPAEEPKPNDGEEKSVENPVPDVASTNMKNAEMSGLYFYRPSSHFIVSPGTQTKYEVEGVYELENGILMIKVGPDEYQINYCPYTGYGAMVQLPEVDADYLEQEKNNITLKSPEGGEEEKGK